MWFIYIRFIYDFYIYSLPGIGSENKSCKAGSIPAICVLSRGVRISEKREKEGKRAGTEEGAQNRQTFRESRMQAEGSHGSRADRKSQARVGGAGPRKPRPTGGRAGAGLPARHTSAFRSGGAEARSGPGGGRAAEVRPALQRPGGGGAERRAGSGSGKAAALGTAGRRDLAGEVGRPGRRPGLSVGGRSPESASRPARPRLTLALRLHASPCSRLRIRGVLSPAVLARVRSPPEGQGAPGCAHSLQHPAVVLGYPSDGFGGHSPEQRADLEPGARALGLPRGTGRVRIRG